MPASGFDVAINSGDRRGEWAAVRRVRVPAATRDCYPTQIDQGW